MSNMEKLMLKTIMSETFLTNDLTILTILGISKILKNEKINQVNYPKHHFSNFQKGNMSEKTLPEISVPKISSR